MAPMGSFSLILLMIDENKVYLAISFPAHPVFTHTRSYTYLKEDVCFAVLVLNASLDLSVIRTEGLSLSLSLSLSEIALYYMQTISSERF
jgi:hypothetical protein